jgi:hypothetical protein
MEQETIDTGNTIKTSHLLIGLAFILFIVGSVVYGLWNRNPDRSEWVRGTAQVIETFYGRTGGRKYVYKVNGKTTLLLQAEVLQVTVQVMFMKF